MNKEKILDDLSSFDLSFHIVKNKYSKIYIKSEECFSLEKDKESVIYIINGDKSRLLEEYLEIISVDNKSDEVVKVIYNKNEYFICNDFINGLKVFLNELTELLYYIEFDEEIYFSELKEYKKLNKDNTYYDKKIFKDIKNTSLAKYIRVSPVDSSMYMMSKKEFKELKLNNRLHYLILKEYNSRVENFFERYVAIHKKVESKNEEYVSINKDHDFIVVNIRERSIKNLLKVFLEDFEKLSVENNFDKVKLVKIKINETSYRITKTCKIIALTTFYNINYLYSNYEFDENKFFLEFPSLGQNSKVKDDNVGKTLKGIEKIFIGLTILDCILGFVIMENYMMIIGFMILLMAYVFLLLSVIFKKFYIKHRIQMYKTNNILS
ncbi:MAG: hypothetical protein ACRCTZ_05040 [Sarcina sp.]